MFMTHPPVDATAAYAANRSSGNQSSAKQSPAETVHCFSLRAMVDPGLLPRVIEIFAKNGLVPSRWHSDLLAPHEDELTIDIQVMGLAGERAEYLARCMNQIYGVHTVLISRKH